MFKEDAVEAYPLMVTVLNALLSWTATRGRTGADLRSAISDVKVAGLRLLQTDSIDVPLIECFELARRAGINMAQIEHVRVVASQQVAKSVGAIMTKDTLIELALMTQGYLISAMTFVSRQDVDDVKNVINAGFSAMEEELADQMDAMTYRAVIALHASIVMHLYETARPLPRMINFRFNQALPSVVMAHRLYADAGRADELRRENKIVHPAFMAMRGKALSS
jgi:prophage DNA circulation protein